jgi:hypothetical protein
LLEEEEISHGETRVDPADPGDKRYIRRDDKGHFTDQQDDVGRSLAEDQRKDAKHIAKRGQGDRGDRQSSEKLRTKTSTVSHACGPDRLVADHREVASDAARR